MSNWVIRNKKADFKAISEKFAIDPLLAKCIRNRDVVGDEAVNEYLNGGLECLKDPLFLKDMEKAAGILKQLVAEKKRIRVIGDYDIDGIMASYILKRGITELGGIADVRISDRVVDGYGMNERMVREAEADGVEAIVTCDNGAAAIQPIALAKSLGMTVIVTDHHEVVTEAGEDGKPRMVLPCADAVVDQKRFDDDSPNRNLCGAAIAWKLILAAGGDARYDLLQYAAFATIGDVVDLLGENRVIVKEGLKRLRHSDNLGLFCLAEECGIQLDTLTAYHVGFILGPCLNASGRLDTAMKALALLETDDHGEAVLIASELKALNDKRRAMTAKGTEDAVAVIERNGMADDKVLVVFVPDLHESIAGIVAGRIRELYGRPAFILAEGAEHVKGSGRSTEAYPMKESLDGVSDLLLRYGGHPMAAGLTIEKDRIGELRTRLNDRCTLTPEQLVPKVRIDEVLSAEYVTEDLIEELEKLEPFGKGNEKPVFAIRGAVMEDARILGAKRNVLKAAMHMVDKDGKASYESYEAIAFENIEALDERIRTNPHMSIVFDPKINEFRGRKTIQFVIKHYL